MMDECKGEARRSRSKSVREMRWLQRKWQESGQCELRRNSSEGTKHNLSNGVWYKRYNAFGIKAPGWGGTMSLPAPRRC